MRRRVLEREPDARHRVTDVEEAARLAPFAVDRQRQSDGGLDAEAVEDRPPDRVVIEPRGQPRMHHHLVSPASVDDALVQIGRS